MANFCTQVHIFGEDACELVHYATALAQSGKTVRQVLGTTFAAVTYHELFQIAALQAVEILEGDAWSDILQQIAGDCSQVSFGMHNRCWSLLTCVGLF